MRIYLIGILLFISGHAFSEEYVFSVTWEPEFCNAKPKNVWCKSLDSKQFGAKNFSLHGLWPQSSDYCTGNSSDEEADKNFRWSELPKLALSPKTRSRLDEIMAPLSNRHEWVKHGSCSGVSQEVYFKKSIDLTDQLAETTFASLLRSRIGQKTSLELLQNFANNEFGEQAKKSIEFLCARNTDHSQALFEIRFHLDADSLEEINLKKLVSTSLHRPTKSKCVNGLVYIRAIE